MEAKVTMSARNVPILELNNICMMTQGYLDVKEEEVVLFELKVEKCR